jgi:hypothetical protein
MKRIYLLLVIILAFAACKETTERVAKKWAGKTVIIPADIKPIYAYKKDTLKYFNESIKKALI